MSATDPIQKSYTTIKKAENFQSCVFYLSIILSFAVLFPKAITVNKDFLQIAFLICSLSLVVTDFAIKFYLFPRAEALRIQDFLSNALSVKLIHKTSIQYYNSTPKNIYERINAQVLENSFFTKSILSEMAIKIRAITFIYIIIWLICILTRATEIESIIAISQFLFSEHILTKWIKIECLKIRSEKTFSDVYNIMLNKISNNTHFKASTLFTLIYYETSKANTGVLLSSFIFEKLNSELTQEWEEIQRILFKDN